MLESEVFSNDLLAAKASGSFTMFAARKINSSLHKTSFTSRSANFMNHVIQNVWSRVVVSILLRIVTSQSIAQSPGKTEVVNNETAICEFIEAWSRLDPDELLNYFIEDGRYCNMSTSPSYRS